MVDLLPLNRQQTLKLIESIRSYPLLRGVRGEPPADIEALIEAILGISQMITDFPEIMEMDINPLLVKNRGEGVMAIDARITIKEDD